MDASFTRRFSRFDLRAHKWTSAEAEALLNAGQFQEARALLQKNVDLSDRVLGAEHSVTLDDQDSLSDCLQELGKFGEAVALDRITLHARKRSDVKGHKALATQHSLASNLAHLKQYDEAIQLNRATLGVREQILGKSHADTLETKHNLASNLHRSGQDKEASELNRQVLQIRERSLRADDYDLIACRHNLATNLHALGELDKAMALTTDNLIPLRSTRSKHNPQMEAVLAFQTRVQSDIQTEAEKLKKKEADRLEALKAQEKLRVLAIAEDEALKKAEAEALKKAEDEKRRDAQRKQARREKELAMERQKELDKQRQIELDKTMQEPSDRKHQEKFERKRREELEREEEERLKAEAVLQKQKAEEERVKAEALVQKQIEVDRQKQQEMDRIGRDETEGERASNSKAKRMPGEFPAPEQATPRLDAEPKGNRSASLLPAPSKGHKPRPKSNDLSVPMTSSDTGLEVSSTRKQRSKSADTRPREQAESIAPQTRVYTYSNLCDSHEGSVHDTAAIQGVDIWFREFNSRTQALIAQGRKPSGRRVKVAILDTGIDLAHPDFSKLDEDHPEYGIPKDRIKGRKGFVGSNNTDRDCSGHGTHSVALLLKLAPKANIYVARVDEDGSGSVYSEVVAKAILHATNEWKVDIITMSFGWSHYHPCVEQAIAHASSRQVILCAAASNDGANNAVAFPANCSPVIRVHSANGYGIPSHFTPPPLNFGANFSVIGEAVSSTWPGETLEKRRWGTSTSTPILAAIMALVLEFINQKPVKTSHDLRLETPMGMTQTLLAMSQLRQDYHYVMPWKLLDSRVGRVRVESRILDSLDELFGPEASEQDPLR